jgi:hypothetical protein
MGSSDILRQIESDAARFGFIKNYSHSRDSEGGRNVVWQIHCSKCPREFSAYWGVRTSPALMVKNMRRRGWDIGLGERPLCPDCAHPKRDYTPPVKPPPNGAERYVQPETAIVAALKKAVEQKQPAMIAPLVPRANKEKPMTETKAPPTPSPKISHAVFGLLDDTFDAEKRQYKNSYSDARVAQECGTTEEVVVWLRRETFGELAEDPIITTLKEEIELMRMEVAENVAALTRTFSPRLDQLANRVEQIAMRVKAR